jgi:hypothetical protein
METTSGQNLRERSITGEPHNSPEKHLKPVVARSFQVRDIFWITKAGHPFQYDLC